MQTQPFQEGHGQRLWSPTPEQAQSSRLHDYQQWLACRGVLPAGSYEDLWRWSVDDLDGFWLSIWEYFDVIGQGERKPVLSRREMPGASWFPGVQLNYAENVFRNATGDRPAIIARSEGVPLCEVTWIELERDTAALAAKLHSWDIGAGDRVAGFLPNRAETVIAFLACASIGAIWSSCEPDMGPSVVLDRLRQIEPRLLIAADSYSYNGKKMEVPIRKLLLGAAVEKVASPDAMQNPKSLQFFVVYAQKLAH